MSTYNFIGIGLYLFPQDADLVDAHARVLVERWTNGVGVSRPMMSQYDSVTTPGTSGDGRRWLFRDIACECMVMTYRYGDTVALVAVYCPRPQPEFGDRLPDALPATQAWRSWLTLGSPVGRPYQNAFLHIVEGRVSRAAEFGRPFARVRLPEYAAPGEHLTLSLLTDGEYMVEGPENNRFLHDWVFEVARPLRLAMFHGKALRYARELNAVESGAWPLSRSDRDNCEQKKTNVETAVYNFRHAWEDAGLGTMAESTLGRYFDSALTRLVANANGALEHIHETFPNRDFTLPKGAREGTGTPRTPRDITDLRADAARPVGATPMPFQHLSPDHITAVYNAATALGLTTSRAALFGNMAPAFVSSLAANPSPAAQLLSDLHALNTIEALTDGNVPLHRWLTNARDLTSVRPESAVFQRALDQVAGNATHSPHAVTSALPMVQRTWTPRTPAEILALRPREAATTTRVYEHPADGVSSRPPMAPAQIATAGIAPGSTRQATAVFVSIAALTSMDGPSAHAAMSALHGVLRERLIAAGHVPGIRVLSCLSGAIVLVPDEAGVEVVDLFAEVAPAIASAGLGVHAGIAHGPVAMLPDADATLNAVGVCMNVAARLAYATANPGVLVHETYADHAFGILPDTHWLHPARRSAVEVPGKRQEMFRCFAAPLATPTAAPSRTAARPPFVNAVLLAYDLPSFSEGDARQLASRFGSVVQEVVRLRETGAIPQDARFSFSPGGDGAVLVLAGFHESRAHELAERLQSLLAVETSLKAEGAGARARISVHYGPVFFYESAEGPLRPTGPTLFDTDALASDDEARKHDSVIVSGALIDLSAHGSRAYQREHFDEIEALPRAHGRTIRRFVRRTTALPPVGAA